MILSSPFFKLSNLQHSTQQTQHTHTVPSYAATSSFLACLPLYPIPYSPSFTLQSPATPSINLPPLLYKTSPLLFVPFQINQLLLLYLFINSTQMGTLCTEQNQHQHEHQLDPQLHLLSPTKQSPLHPHHHRLLQDPNIPPRKLLSRRAAAASLLLPISGSLDFFSDSSSSSSPSKHFADAAAALMHKFLPYNGDSSDLQDDGFDPDADPYSSDQFRMFEFKVRRCTRSRSHDWTDCPFAHPGEKARRRDPRKYHYSGTVCPEYRRGGCSRGDDCEFAHGVFECWLHPVRYRTEACKDGKNCKRKVCFFAHSPRELRILPFQDSEDEVGKFRNLNHGVIGHCCKYCCPSPTSTLLAGMAHMSPPLSPPAASPPLSPVSAVVPRGGAGFSTTTTTTAAAAVSRIIGGDRLDSRGGLRGTYDDLRGLSYKELALNELMSSMEGVNILNDGLGGGNVPWVDVVNGDDDCICGQQQQQQFVMSPSSTPNPPPMNYFNSLNCFDPCAAAASSGYRDNIGFNSNDGDDSRTLVNGGGAAGPDLGWVNDLLM
ncbi:hypothetical protein Dimus_009550 [Dionaea muscipula]